MPRPKKMKNTKDYGKSKPKCPECGRTLKFTGTDTLGNSMSAHVGIKLIEASFSLGKEQLISIWRCRCGGVYGVPARKLQHF